MPRLGAAARKEMQSSASGFLTLLSTRLRERENNCALIRESPDMMSASEGEGGGHGKADAVGRLHEFYTTVDNGGQKNPKILRMSFTEAPLLNDSSLEWL